MLALDPKVHPTLPVDHRNPKCPGPGWMRVPFGCTLKPGDIFSCAGLVWLKTTNPGIGAVALSYFRAGIDNPGYALHEDEGG